MLILARVSAEILGALEEISERVRIVFPVHPRTRKTMAEFGFSESSGRNANLHLVDPLGYLDFLRLFSGAQLVLTDSGGIQEETTALGIPCLTLRENTERPITVEMGTNKLVGSDRQRIVQAAFSILDGPSSKPGRVPALWDGHTAERIVSCLLEVSAGARQSPIELPAR